MTAAVSKYRLWWAISAMVPPTWAVMSGARISSTAEYTKETSTPTDTRVSIVDEPCRAARNAAEWNGHAAHSATGAARANATQPQCGNCSAGTMEINTSGTVSTAAPIRRGLSTSSLGPWAMWSWWSTPSWSAACSSPCSSPCSEVCACPACPACPAGGAGRRTVAPYPAFSTAATSSSSDTPAGAVTVACSSGRFTDAVTPSSLPSLRSTRPTHEAQVMPVTSRSTRRVVSACGPAGVEEAGWVMGLSPPPACSRPPRRRRARRRGRGGPRR